MAKEVADLVRDPFPTIRSLRFVDSSPTDFGEALERISVLGQPSSRYDPDGFDITTADILLVDQVVKYLRDQALADYSAPAKLSLGTALGQAAKGPTPRFPVDQAEAWPDSDEGRLLLRQNAAWDPALELELDSALITVSPFAALHLAERNGTEPEVIEAVRSWAAENLRLDSETLAKLKGEAVESRKDRHRGFSMTLE